MVTFGYLTQEKKTKFFLAGGGGRRGQIFEGIRKHARTEKFRKVYI
jgi:hypothetical protein